MGAFTAVSVAQGGPGLAEAVFAYFSTGKTINLNIPTEELPPMIKHLVQQVM